MYQVQVEWSGTFVWAHAEYVVICCSFDLVCYGMAWLRMQKGGRAGGFEYLNASLREGLTVC